MHDKISSVFYPVQLMQSLSYLRDYFAAADGVKSVLYVNIDCSETTYEVRHYSV